MTRAQLYQQIQSFFGQPVEEKRRSEVPGLAGQRGYTAFGKDRPHGYHEEKWHWSYKPLSKEITNTAKRIMSNDNITGFLGSETAKEIDVLNKYILGVNPNCSH